MFLEPVYTRKERAMYGNCLLLNSSDPRMKGHMIQEEKNAVFPILPGLPCGMRIQHRRPWEAPPPGSVCLGQSLTLSELSFPNPGTVDGCVSGLDLQVPCRTPCPSWDTVSWLQKLDRTASGAPRVQVVGGLGAVGSAGGRGGPLCCLLRAAPAVWTEVPPWVNGSQPPPLPCSGPQAASAYDAS